MPYWKQALAQIAPTIDRHWALVQIGVSVALWAALIGMALAVWHLAAML